MKSDMKLDQLGRYCLIAGGVLVMLAASLFIGARLMKSHYRFENEKVFEAIGRQLSGTNDRARERMERMRTGGAWLLGLGLAGMGVGGVFYVYGSKKNV